jgi:carbamoyl-phosphate synthase large subunit
MTKRRLTVAVTALNAIDNPGPGVGVIRCLRACPEFDLRIIGLSYETLEPGAYMHDLVDVSYQVPYPSAGSGQLLNRLLEIHEAGRLDFVIPNFDAELRNYIKIAPDLRREGIGSFLPEANALTQIDKMHLAEFCKGNGLATPRTKFINSLHEIERLEEEFEYPVFVKGAFYEAFKAVNKGQIQAYFHHLSAKWGLPVIIQELVEGTEIDIAGLADGRGRLMGAVPMRKLYITDKGKGWSGVVLSDPSLIEVTRQFAQSSRWRGGFELEFMRTIDDRLLLIEVNPRFPAWIYTTAAVGQNLPASLLKMGLDLPVEPYDRYQEGKMFVRYAWELIADIDEFQRFSTTGMLMGSKPGAKDKTT